MVARRRTVPVLARASTAGSSGPLDGRRANDGMPAATTLRR